MDDRDSHFNIEIGSDSEFVTEVDEIPIVWNYLLGLNRNDLIAELVQNDLDQIGKGEVEDDSCVVVSSILNRDRIANREEAMRPNSPIPRSNGVNFTVGQMSCMVA